MTPSDILRKAAELIADPKHWVRCTRAVSPNGEWVDAKSPKAVRWCASGAIYRVDSNEWKNIFYKFKEVFGKNIVDINDYEDHAYTIGAMMHVADKMDGII